MNISVKITAKIKTLTRLKYNKKASSYPARLTAPINTANARILDYKNF